MTACNARLLYRSTSAHSWRQSTNRHLRRDRHSFSREAHVRSLGRAGALKSGHRSGGLVLDGIDRSSRKRRMAEEGHDDVGLVRVRGFDGVSTDRLRVSPAYAQRLGVLVSPLVTARVLGATVAVLSREGMRTRRHHNNIRARQVRGARRGNRSAPWPGGLASRSPQGPLTRDQVVQEPNG